MSTNYDETADLKDYNASQRLLVVCGIASVFGVTAGVLAFLYYVPALLGPMLKAFNHF